MGVTAHADDCAGGVAPGVLDPGDSEDCGDFADEDEDDGDSGGEDGGVVSGSGGDEYAGE